MTHASTHGKSTPRTILSRLLVVLALVLFGVPHSHADGVTSAGPVAQSQVEQAQGILTVQRQLLRAHLPDNPSPDAVVPGPAVEAVHFFFAGMPPAPPLTLLHSAIRILPPVRGPPAV